MVGAEAAGSASGPDIGSGLWRGSLWGQAARGPAAGAPARPLRCLDTAFAAAVDGLRTGHVRTLRTAYDSEDPRKGIDVATPGGTSGAPDPPARPIPKVSTVARMQPLVRPLAPILLGVLFAAGCQVTTVVTVQVDDDGSGTVEVTLCLDSEALANVPDLNGDGTSDAQDLVQLVRTDDLTAASWDVRGPTTDGDTTLLRVTKPFGSPDEAVSVLGELTGPDGPLRDLRVVRDTWFGGERFRFSGVADLSGGLEDFADEALADELDGNPLGEDPADIEQRFGRPIGEMFQLDVHVALPGGHEQAWSPTLGGQPVEMAAETTVYNPIVLGLAAFAALCAVALLLLIVVRLLRRNPSR